MPSPETPPGDTFHCPLCAEAVSPDLERCSACGERFESEPAPARPAGTIVFGVFNVMGGLVTLLAIFGQVAVMTAISATRGTGMAPGVVWGMAGVSLVLLLISGGLIGSAVGLFLLRPWGRLLALIFSATLGALSTIIAVGVIIIAFTVPKQQGGIPMAMASTVYFLGAAFFVSEFVYLVRRKIADTFRAAQAARERH